jgi:hypothetical protein
VGGRRDATPINCLERGAFELHRPRSIHISPPGYRAASGTNAADRGDLWGYHKLLV